MYMYICFPTLSDKNLDFCLLFSQNSKATYKQQFGSNYSMDL